MALSIAECSHRTDDRSKFFKHVHVHRVYIHTYVHGVHREKDWHNYSSMVTVFDAFMQNTSPAQSVELGHLTLYIEEGMHVGSLGNMHESGS